MFDLVRPTRVAGAIEIYDGAFSNCQRIIDVINNMPNSFDRALVGDGQVSDKRTSDAAGVDLTSLRNPTVIFEFGRTLFGYLDDYGKRYSVGFSSLEPASLNRYEIGQEYKAHADDGPGHPRVISALIYMNDVEQGGETVFPLFGESVSPKEGRLVIFPSNYAYVHEARPPLAGVKYSLAVWATPVP